MSSQSLLGHRGRGALNVEPPFVPLAVVPELHELLTTHVSPTALARINRSAEYE